MLSGLNCRFLSELGEIFAIGTVTILCFVFCIIMLVYISARVVTFTGIGLDHFSMSDLSKITILLLGFHWRKVDRMNLNDCTVSTIWWLGIKFLRQGMRFICLIITEKCDRSTYIIVTRKMDKHVRTNIYCTNVDSIFSYRRNIIIFVSHKIMKPNISLDLNDDTIFVEEYWWKTFLHASWYLCYFSMCRWLFCH